MEKSLTEEELKTLKKRAFEVLSQTRHSLLDEYPFIGSIALHMDLVPVRDLRVRTACTDGNCIYFDIAFLSSLNDDERAFVMAHEIWHAVLMHLTRRGTRNHELFNIATDKEVNNLLKEDGLIPPADLCFPDENEKGKCAEEIYEMMLQKLKQQNKQKGNQSQSSSGNKGKGSSKKNGNGSKNGSGKPNGKPGQPNGDDEQKEDDRPSGSNQPGGNKDGKLKGQFDKHIYDGDQSNHPNKNAGDGSNAGSGNMPAEGEETISDKYGEVGFDSDFQPQVPKGFNDRMRETIISEAQRVEKMAKHLKGNLPSHIKSLVNKILTPEISWQEILAQFVTKCYNSGNRSWIPPNRRHVHNDLYLQSRQSSKIKTCVVIDTSGSTMGDRTKFLTELNGLVNSFGNYEITIICADAEVDDVKTYTQDDNLNIEIDGYEMHGGGGTSFIPPFQYVLDHKIECDCLLYLTDGYGPAPEKNPIGIPVMWVITKDGTEDFCDWGQKIRLKQTDNDF